jgi:DNA-binding NtrC family response regulator
LKILPLELPPLRDRKDDIPLLVTGFLKSFNEAYNKRIKGLTHQAMQMLMEHEWEGNVRELKHSIERAVVLEEGEWITDNDFEFEAKKTRQTRRKVIAASPESLPPKEIDTLMLMVPLDHASVSEVQRMLAQKVLDHFGGNKARAARILHISRPRLDRILGKAKDDDEE